MYQAATNGLEHFLAESFTLSDLNVMKVEVRQHFFALSVGSSGIHEENAIFLYGTHNDIVHKFLSVDPSLYQGIVYS